MQSPSGNLGEKRDKAASAFFKRKIKGIGRIMTGLPYRQPSSERDKPRIAVRDA